MKQVIILFIGSLSFFFQSCHDSFKIDMQAERNYQQDVVVMNKLVDINKTTHEFYINPGKRNSALSYITNSEAQELNSVNPMNLSIFKDNLMQVNSQAGHALSSHSIDYIVMITNSEIYVNKVNRLSPINLNKVIVDSHRDKYIHTSINVMGEMEQRSFYSGNEIETRLELNPQSYMDTGWSFYALCKTGKEDTVNVLFCGVGYNYNISFEWQWDHYNESNIEWDFTIMGGFSNNNQGIAKLNFLQ